jgi:hypothetical protein
MSLTGTAGESRRLRLEGRPKEDALERVGIGPIVGQLGFEPLAVAFDEAREPLRREPRLIVGEERPLHPLDDARARLEQVEVDLQAHLLLREARAVQQESVVLRIEHRASTAVAAERIDERRLGGDLGGDSMRRMVEVRGDLDRELTARGERRPQAREELRVAAHPVQRRVREDEVVRAGRIEALDLSALEADAISRVRRRLREHRFGRVDAERLAGTEALVQDARQLSGTAAEVDDAHPGARPNEGEQIVERLCSLVAKAGVLLGAPAHGRGVGEPPEPRKHLGATPGRGSHPYAIDPVRVDRSAANWHALANSCVFHWMEERSAQAVALVRAFEEADGAGLLLRPEDRRAATEAARTAESPEAQAARRARPLLDLLEREVPGLARARSWSRFGLGIVLPVGIAAFALGLASDALGPGREVNLLSFPLLALLAWNLGVYLFLIAVPIVRAARSRPSPPDDDLAYVAAPDAAAGSRFRGLGAAFAWVAGWALRHVGRRDPREGEVLTRALASYWREWGPAFAPLAAARIAVALHLGAAMLAIGTVSGMYLRGLTFAYGVNWESTFLEARTVAAILSFVLAPASALTGLALPTPADLEALRGAVGGQGAAPWIHLWAVTAALVVLLPRLALAAVELVRQARLARTLPIEPLRGSFRALLAPARGQGTLVQVLPYSLRLDARAMDQLGELLHEVFGVQADVRIAAPLEYGAPADGASPVPSCFVVVYPAVQSPEREVHGRFLQELTHGNGGPDLLVIVDASAWSSKRGAASDERRRAERRRAWDRVLRESGAAGLHLDLSAPLPDDAVVRAEECLRPKAR